MTLPKTYQYRIQYTDNTFQVVDWTREDFKRVFTHMEEDKKVIQMRDGIFRLEHVKAIVQLKEEQPEQTEQDQMQQTSPLTEWGFVDQETIAWLRANGVDVTKGVN